MNCGCINCLNKSTFWRKNKLKRNEDKLHCCYGYNINISYIASYYVKFSKSKVCITINFMKILNAITCLCLYNRPRMNKQK